MLVLSLGQSLHVGELHEIRRICLGLCYATHPYIVTTPQVFDDNEDSSLLLSYSPMSGAVINSAEGRIIGLLLSDQLYIAFDSRGLILHLCSTCDDCLKETQSSSCH